VRLRRKEKNKKERIVAGMIGGEAHHLKTGEAEISRKRYSFFWKLSESISEKGDAMTTAGRVCGLLLPPAVGRAATETTTTVEAETAK
jgi:hypothetical protein